MFLKRQVHLKNILFVTNGIYFQPIVCNGCHDILMISIGCHDILMISIDINSNDISNIHDMLIIVKFSLKLLRVKPLSY